MKREQYEGIVRHLLGAVGAYAVASGAADQDLVIQATGALATLAAIAWSLWEKRNAKA